MNSIPSYLLALSQDIISIFTISQVGFGDHSISLFLIQILIPNLDISWVNTFSRRFFWIKAKADSTDLKFKVRSGFLCILVVF